MVVGYCGIGLSIAGGRMLAVNQRLN